MQNRDPGPEFNFDKGTKYWRYIRGGRREACQRQLSELQSHQSWVRTRWLLRRRRKDNDGGNTLPGSVGRAISGSLLSLPHLTPENVLFFCAARGTKSPFYVNRILAKSSPSPPLARSFVCPVLSSIFFGGKKSGEMTRKTQIREYIERGGGGGGKVRIRANITEPPLPPSTLHPPAPSNPSLCE